MQIWAIIYLYDCNRNKCSTEKLKSPPPFPPPNLQATNILFCPAHISGSQQEADFADHHSLDDYLGNIFQKSSCDSQNIFFPPLPMTFKVVLLLPAAPDGRHKLRSHPWWFVLALAHARTHAQTEWVGGYKKLGI